MISITVTGNLGKDAEYKDDRLKFSVASSEKVKDEKVTTWVNCTIFGKRGGALEQYMKKGTKVCVVGTGSLRTYTSNGETRTTLDVRVDQVDLMGGGTGQQSSAAPPSRPQAPKYEPPQQAALDDGEIPF